MKLTPAQWRLVRRWIYRTINAAVAVAVVYRLVDGDQAAAWLLLVNAALGLADANVTDGNDE